MSISAHIMVHEPPPAGSTWDALPIKFDTITTLYISPFIVMKDFTFGIGDSGDKDTIYSERLSRMNSVINQAREANSNIKIIVMQMNQRGRDLSILGTPQSRETYAESVKEFLKDNPRIDGYDVDYEWNDDQDRGNMQQWSADLLHLVRQKLDGLRSSPRYHVSISPASIEQLDGRMFLANDLDCVNLQTYDGCNQGSTVLPDVWTKGIGVNPSQLFWGITAEKPWLNYPTVASDVDNAIKEYQGSGSGNKVGPLGGIMLWRLNSDNYVYEDMVHLYLSNQLRKTAIKGDLGAMVKSGWENGGRKSRDDFSVDNQADGFKPADWIKAGKYRP